MSEGTKANKVQALETDKVRERQRSFKSSQDSTKVLSAESIPFVGFPGTSAANPPLDRHVALLGELSLSHHVNAIQRTRIVNELQRSYGNAYVQMVINLVRNKKQDKRSTELAKDISAKRLRKGKNGVLTRGQHALETIKGGQLLTHKDTWREQAPQVTAGEAQSATRDEWGVIASPGYLEHLASPAVRQIGKTQQGSKLSRLSWVLRKPATRVARRVAKPRGYKPTWIQAAITIGGAKYRCYGRVCYKGTRRVSDMKLDKASFTKIENAILGHRQLLPKVIRAILSGRVGKKTLDLTTAAKDGSMFKFRGRRRWVLHQRQWLYVRPYWRTSLTSGPGGQRHKVHEFKGHFMTGGGRVRDVLTKYKNSKDSRFKLSSTGTKVPLTDHLIAVLDGAAAVESDGQIGCVNAWDKVIVSMGFVQPTLGTGHLQKIYDLSPKGFQSHGIKFTSDTYPVRSSGRNIVDRGVRKVELAGKLVQQAKELRKPESVVRFYAASLEPDVVAAQVHWYKKERLGPAMKGWKRQGRDHMSNPAVQAVLAEAYNFRPAWFRPIGQAARNANAWARTPNILLNRILRAMVQTYKRKSASRREIAQAKAIVYRIRKTMAKHL